MHIRMPHPRKDMATRDLLLNALAEKVLAAEQELSLINEAMERAQSETDASELDALIDRQYL